MITFPIEVGKDGVYTVHGYVNGHPWVAYGQTAEEVAAHAAISRTSLLQRLYGGDHDKSRDESSGIS